jgi:hypothetical protein
MPCDNHVIFTGNAAARKRLPVTNYPDLVTLIPRFSPIASP